MLQINESGLKIFSIEDLQTAAEKSVQFSKVVKMGKRFRRCDLTPIADIIDVSTGHRRRGRVQFGPLVMLWKASFGFMGHCSFDISFYMYTSDDSVQSNQNHVQANQTRGFLFTCASAASSNHHNAIGPPPGPRRCKHWSARSRSLPTPPRTDMSRTDRTDLSLNTLEVRFEVLSSLLLFSNC